MDSLLGSLQGRHRYDINQDGDRGGLAESEQTESRKEKVCLDINWPSHGRS